jgi:crotonobetaine/carnitine-CoA ligase
VNSTLPDGRAYAGIGDPARATLIDALEWHGVCRPDDAWVRCVGGTELSFGHALAEARQVAGLMASLGVAPGERVIVMLPNGLDFIRVWLGLGRLGAVAVLLNTELHGRFLEHQLGNCEATMAVVDASLLPAFGAACRAVPRITHIVVAGTMSVGAETGVSRLDDWRKAPAWTGPAPRPQDPACIMYTSGTSGPAKGVVMPHAHCALYGIGTIKAFDVRRHDRYYIVLPLFHVNGLLMQLGATLLAGIPAIVRSRFSASEWLADLRESGATLTNMLGTLFAFVIVQPPTGRDRQHRLRVLLNAPNPADQEAIFRDRFGVPDVISGFGMTEVNIPVWGRLGQSRPGAAGWVHGEHFEICVADSDTDVPRAPGELGEILVRPKIPFGFMAGYHDMPDKTVAAWRNLWFHTGDAGTLDEEGLLTFVDRIKDCIRRRGENISATEIEAEMASLEGVLEVAACAVRSGRSGGEDEILLCAVVDSSAGLTLEAIAAHADRVLPRFAWPRFIEFMAELPKTSTGKIQRAQLRQRGAATAWDREARQTRA